MSLNGGENVAVGKALTCVPHFDRLVVRARNDRLAVGGEGDRHDHVVVRVLLGRFELKRTCKGCGKGVRGERQPLEIASNGSPASQTLMVPEEAPETILEPSGEYFTLIIPNGPALLSV